ncbi:MAG: hypothetical protein HXY24_04070 [Rubrivivax sp.]|nr:hypothetical protein [Rubrivivax sp.]
MHEITDLIDQIRTLQRVGAHGRAVALARHALATSPRVAGRPCLDTTAKLHYLAGLSLDAQGRDAEAATHYVRAMDRVMDRLTAELAAAAPWPDRNVTGH